MTKYVKVSPDYHGDGWWDPKSEKWFKKDETIAIEDGVDMTNITRYLRFNYLVEVVEPVKAVATTGVVEQTAGQLLAEEKAVEIVETVEETKVEEVVAETVEEAPVEEVKDTEVEAKSACPYCSKEYKDLAKHVKACKKNPDNK